MQTKKSLPIAFCLLAFAGQFFSCAGSRSFEYQAKYNTTVGLATTRTFFDQSNIILTQYNFLIERTEEYGNAYHIETRWSVGPPTDDEALIGVYQTRIRVILRARAREISSRGNVANRMNQVTFTGESEVMFEGSNKWQKVPLSEERKNYFKQIAEDLKTEFNTGIRLY